jgi:hypothetical protein
MNSRICGILLAVLFTAALLGCQGKGASPTAVYQQRISPEAKEVLEGLNDWPAQALDAIECSEGHHANVDTGETRSWVASRRQMLEEMGYKVRWNCHEMKYEVAESEEALCDCVSPTP